MWTHLEGFNDLSAGELDALLLAPVWITILVGAADGELDREERTWSDRLLRARTYNKPYHLNEYYQVVSHLFLDKVDEQMAVFPDDTEARNQLLSDKLATINPILVKVGPPLAADLYRSFVGLARETAKASGGFLRIGAISAAEAKWVNLPMLTPIEGATDMSNNWEEEETDEYHDEKES